MLCFVGTFKNSVIPTYFSQRLLLSQSYDVGRLKFPQSTKVELGGTWLALRGCWLIKYLAHKDSWRYGTDFKSSEVEIGSITEWRLAVTCETALGFFLLCYLITIKPCPENTFFFCSVPLTLLLFYPVSESELNTFRYSTVKMSSVLTWIVFTKIGLFVSSFLWFFFNFFFASGEEKWDRKKCRPPSSLQCQTQLGHHCLRYFSLFLFFFLLKQ